MRNINTKQALADRPRPCSCKGDPIGDEYRRDIAAAEEELYLCADILAEEKRDLPRRSLKPQKTNNGSSGNDNDDDEGGDEEVDDGGEDSFEDVHHGSSSNSNGNGDSTRHLNESDGDDEDDELDEHDRQHHNHIHHHHHHHHLSKTRSHQKKRQQPSSSPSAPLPPLGKPRDPPGHVYLLRMWLRSKDMMDYVKRVEDFIDVMDDAIRQHTFDRLKRAQRVEDNERRFQHEIEMVKARAMYMIPAPIVHAPPPATVASAVHAQGTSAQQ
ncbi:hypothetical protein BGX29_007707 [Mortierella sp. GBA35]|nr:hypothetical protein BGX29_007707 [Mortierella sp. GBA35]